MRIIKFIKLLRDKRRERVKKIFEILKGRAVQTQQFKAPILHHLDFEKTAEQIDREIR